jgi:hypothetical protein
MLPILALLVLVAGLGLTASPAAAQAVVSESLDQDPRVAAMGGAGVALGGGSSWAGFRNPAAHARQPLLHGGYARADLDPWRSGAELASGVAGLSFAGAVGVGVLRSTFAAGPTVFAAVPGDPGAPERVLSPGDRTDAAGAAVDLVRLLSSPHRNLELILGANYKRMVRERAPRSDVSPLLAEEEATDWDLGALVGWRFDLGPRPRRETPDGYLRLRGGIAVRNVGAAELTRAGDVVGEELGRTTAAGAALEFGMGRLTARTHALVLTVAGEFRRQELRREDAGRDGPGYREILQGGSVGGEVLLGGFLSTRVGWVDDPARRVDDLTFGAGLQFLIPEIRISVRGDYARVPLRLLVPREAVPTVSPVANHERFGVSAWIDF